MTQFPHFKHTQNFLNKALQFKSIPKNSIPSVPLLRVRRVHHRASLSELEIFKLGLKRENHAHSDLYSDAKQKLLKYRIAFIILGGIFLVLAALTYALSFSWNYAFIFATGFKVKSLLGVFALLLSGTSFSFAYSLSASHEATKELIHKTQRTLKNLYIKHRAHFHLDALLLWGKKYQQRAALYHTYQELAEQAQEQGNETYRLMKKIKKTLSLPHEAKEKLYNQALEQLASQLRETINRFVPPDAL